MSNKVVVHHFKGQKHLGKTHWSKVFKQIGNPEIDEENNNYNN